MLTIIIPSYNHEKYILDCLEAVSAQKNSDYKIIVIDDGSADNTVSVVKDYIRTSGRADISIHCKPNSGLISSLNLGLQMVQTEFVYFVASDDVPRIEGIQKCLEILEAKPNLAFCIGGGDNFFGDSKNLTTPVYSDRHHSFFEVDADKRKQQIFLDFPAPLLLQSVVFRTAVLLEIGGWDTRLLWDDYPMFVKLLSKYSEKGIDFDYLPEIKVVYYRHHGTNSYKNLIKQFSMVHQALEILAPRNIKSRAIGHALALYGLMAVRSGDLRSLAAILSTVNLYSIFYSFPRVITLILRKVVSKK